MTGIGDVHIYVTDLDRAIRFWTRGLGLTIATREATPHSGFAVLEFPDGGAALRLIGPVNSFEDSERVEPGSRPSITFDISTSKFDDALMRLLENGGSQDGEVETYNGLRIVTLSDPDGNAFDLIELPDGE